MVITFKADAELAETIDKMLAEANKKSDTPVKKSELLRALILFGATMPEIATSFVALVRVREVFKSAGAPQSVSSLTSKMADCLRSTWREFFLKEAQQTEATKVEQKRILDYGPDQDHIMIDCLGLAPTQDHMYKDADVARLLGCELSVLLLAIKNINPMRLHVAPIWCPSHVVVENNTVWLSSEMVWNLAEEIETEKARAVAEYIIKACEELEEGRLLGRFQWQEQGNVNVNVN